MPSACRLAPRLRARAPAFGPGKVTCVAKDTKSLNKSDLDDMFQTVRDMVADIDFSELLEGVKVPHLVSLPQAG